MTDDGTRIEEKRPFSVTRHEANVFCLRPLVSSEERNSFDVLGYGTNANSLLL